MGNLKEFVTPLHQQTQRDYVGRMMDNKVECMMRAKEYEADYWDGDRRYGYGGYKYVAGRWKPVAEALISEYDLVPGSRVLDVGCGKSFLLYEMQLLVPELELVGFDVSNHGLAATLPEFTGRVFKHGAEYPFPFEDASFDLVISLGSLHNLRLFDLKKALGEVERVSQASYVMVESYRNELEMFNLECWALTAESIFDKEEWEWLFKEFGYSGDYEFIYFE